MHCKLSMMMHHWQSPFERKKDQKRDLDVCEKNLMASDGVLGWNFVTMLVTYNKRLDALKGPN